MLSNPRRWGRQRVDRLLSVAPPMTPASEHLSALQLSLSSCHGRDKNMLHIVCCTRMSCSRLPVSLYTISTLKRVNQRNLDTRTDASPSARRAPHIVFTAQDVREDLQLMDSLPSLAFSTSSFFAAIPLLQLRGPAGLGPDYIGQAKHLRGRGCCSVALTAVLQGA